MNENPYTPPESEITSGSRDGEAVLASRWARFFGALIDGLIVGGIFSLFAWPSGYVQRAMAQTVTVTEVLLWSLLGVAAFLIVNSYPLMKRGQTVGKLLLGTQIVGVDSNRILSLGHVLLKRYLPVWLASSVPRVGGILGLVDILFIFRADKRCVHDLIAGSKVIVYQHPLD